MGQLLGELATAVGNFDYDVAVREAEGRTLPDALPAGPVEYDLTVDD